MEEKVMSIKLPKGAKYRNVIVTDDGSSVDIVYSEEYTCQHRQDVAKAKVIIPKPKALIDGSEVYQKDKIPYWFCKIKNGRDEFMHVYMDDLTEQDLLIDSKTGKERIFSTDEQKEFKKDVLEAIKDKPKEGFRWIPTFEPSIKSGSWGEIQFVKGNFPYTGLTCYKWEKIFEEYSTENQSGISSKTTYFLLLLRWLKDGIATLKRLANDSSIFGQSWDINQHTTKQIHRLTGEMEFGGLYGYICNTCKIVKDTNSISSFSLLSHQFIGYNGIHLRPLANICHISDPNYEDYNSVGLLELKK